MNKKIIMVSALALAFMLTAIGSGTDDSSSEVASKVGEVSSQESSEDNAESEEENNSEEVKTEFVVGDVLKTDKLNITYLSSGDYTSNNQFIQPAESNKYIFVELFCENISDSDKNISYFDFKCYADGYACDAFYSGDDSLSATLSAGRTTTGKIYFEVPSDAKEIEIEYETDFWKNEKAKLIFEGDKQSGITPEINVSSSENAFKVGDIVESKKLNISYLSCGEYVSDNQFIQPKEDYHFIYCEFEVENISDSDTYISYYDFDCFADGKSCEANYSRDDALSATISAGRKAKGTVTFEVPIDAEVIEVECLLDYWNSGRAVFTYQPE